MHIQGFELSPLSSLDLDHTYWAITTVEKNSDNIDIVARF